jgi:hypothetical protein
LVRHKKFWAYLKDAYQHRIIKEELLKPYLQEKTPNKLWLFGLSLLIISLLTACQPKWEIQVGDGSDIVHVVTPAQWKEWQVYQDEESGDQAILLDRVLSELDYQLIENIRFISADGLSQELGWPDIASQTWLMKDGSIQIGEQSVQVKQIQVAPPLTYFQANASILDIAATVATALDLPAPSDSIGNTLVDQSFERVLLLFLDGYGYLRVMQAVETGISPFMATLDPPLMALATYPPRTQVSSASVLTGAPPKVHGVYGRNTRKTETQTILDVAAENGLTVRAVEGDALSFELRNAEFVLSGDRNGDGKTDDEVLANALTVLENGQPDLFWVHFHGIDDAGHNYGPGAEEEQQMITFVDQAVEQILSRVEPGTLAIIFADHGMHAVSQESKKGNHGNLIEEDMLIPIFLVMR